MNGDLCVFQYSFQPETLEKKKRESNPFFLYRNYMKENAPKNIKMTELSKMASDSWRNLSDVDKAKWKRLYEINRDLPPNTKDIVDEKNSTADKKDLDETTEGDQDPPVAIKVENMD
ncbi:hypothetical protein C1645_745764 [Glomus cerebriforme]|uniref:HMG box domain-containing protein n=1 Tax=Glomus cerebriforme TaxID=658196 RepID=A0A397S4K0_9GLOM|nr:hypothetical protein C1645_745764 [Glomus cerebriforme]